jgi:crotonobetainyl-CoA:carnitine CoA-transferase CaiB-like acyl-CoA transferase
MAPVMAAGQPEPVDHAPHPTVEAQLELPLAGVRVVELGRFAAGPACATLLADWGADVVKVEPPGGDPARGPGSLVAPEDGEVLSNPRYDVHNRSRRGLTLDLATPAGRAALDRVLDQSDVFVTNLSPAALDRLGLTPDDVAREHPRLVVAQVSGYDRDTPSGHRRSYDHGAFWSSAGVAMQFAAPDGVPPQPTGGFGDRATGSILAGAVVAALYRRERTGRGGLVTSSLVNTGLWLMASDVSDILASGEDQRHADRCEVGIPTLNCFRSSDGRWLWLQLMVPEPKWPDLLSALDAEWLDDDPRFRGGDAGRLRAAARPRIELLDEVFRGRRLEEWGKRLDEHGIAWAPVRTLVEAVQDPEVRASSAFLPIEGGQLSVNSPCRFVGAPPRPASRAPSIGEHTDELLVGYGFSADEIAALQVAAPATGEPAAVGRGQ